MTSSPVALPSLVPAVTLSTDDTTRLIFKHATRISKAANLGELIALNSDFARDLAGADRCSLWLIDESAGELWTMVAHGIHSLRIPLEQGIVGACVRDGETILANDLSTDARFLRSVDLGSGYRTEQVLCVPMRSGRRVLGVLQLLNKAGGFTESDAGLAGLLAQFAASAIEIEQFRGEAETARLVQHEIALAADVQARLIPREMPRVKGLSMAAMCRPARMVGGDYYDLVPMGETHFAFTLGDVAGKGIAAAVMMASIQTLLRSMLQRAALDETEGALAAAIGELNRALYLSSAPERYSTLFCAILNLAQRELVYVNAGHIPPWRLSARGELSALTESDAPIGLLPSYSYRETRVRLDPGDLILVVSDGIVEACNKEDVFWEEERVEKIVKEHGHGPVFELPARLYAEADAWADGAEQFDDMTVLVIRVDAEGTSG